jgi:hypothetical protein
MLLVRHGLQPSNEECGRQSWHNTRAAFLLSLQVFDLGCILNVVLKSCV